MSWVAITIGVRIEFLDVFFLRKLRSTFSKLDQVDSRGFQTPSSRVVACPHLGRVDMC